jgi:quinol monooxygenase YgiN
MPYTLVILRAADFDTWKSNFDNEESVAARKAAGEKSYMIMQTAFDPNKFALLNEWEDMVKLSQFIQSDSLRKMQSDSGLIGEPDVFVFGKVEKGSV